MLAELITSRLEVGMQPATAVLVFFLYSALGYAMECLVLTVDKRHLVINRGFVRHLPFCIIYGFGAMTGYALLLPLRDSMLLLFIGGALGATMFEYIVAMLQIRLFGDFWWDYNDKPYNYKGILCLESTIGWGVAAIVVVRYVHGALVSFASRVPERMAVPLAALLVAAYAVDFAASARAARRERQEREMAEYWSDWRER